MKRKQLWCGIFVLIMIIVIIILVCCFFGNKGNTKNPKALLPANEMISEKLEGYDIERYNNISSIMIDDNNLLQANVAQEYIIANSISFRGIEHIDIIVFADGTGKLIQKFFNSKFESEGKMLVDQSISLTKKQVAQVVNVFENNHFWEIPSKHPEERLGLDGNTIFIEGTNGNKYNIISMWSPDDRYEIKKIYNGITYLTELWGLTMKQ